MKRREFINWVGLGVLATSLPAVLAACQSPADDTAEAPTASKAKIDRSPREDGFAAVGTVEELDAQGAISDKKFIRDAIVVIRDPADPAAVVAVTSLCTHQGCTVAWDGDEGVMACPCHQSKFNPDGTVKSGPAKKPLTKYEAKIDGDLVLVQARG